MICFLCNFRPRSVNAKGTAKFKEKIVDSFKYYYPENNIYYEEAVYGISYYFHKRKTDLDADNLSKPIWDALSSVIYSNDKIIKLRYSGVYDINNLITEFDLTKIPKNVYIDFLDYIEKYEHIVYIELGKLKNELYIMGGENYEL
jgi:Holliday junction resolvase RusA-like endonuclease